MMKRRQLLVMLAGTAALVGCQGAQSLPTIPIHLTLPPEITQAIADASDIIGKIDSLSSILPAGVKSLLDKGKALLASIESAVSVQSAQELLAQVTNIVQQLVGFLPSTGSTPSGDTWTNILSAVETVLPIIAKVAGVVLPLIGLRTARQMPVATARAILRRR